MRLRTPRLRRVLGIACLLAAAGWTGFGCGKGEEPSPQSTSSAVPAGGPADKASDFSGWIPYSSDEGRFSVLTPTVFNQNTETTPTDAGDIRFLRFTAQPDFRRINIIVVSLMPEALIAGRNPMGLLQGTREGVIGQFQGTVNAERQMTLDGKAGLEMKLSGISQGMSVSVLSRVFLSGSSLYQLYAICEKGHEDEAAARHFLDSFKLK